MAWLAIALDLGVAWGCGGSGAGNAPSGARSDSGSLDSGTIDAVDGTVTSQDDGGASGDATASSGCESFLNAFCMSLETCEPVNFYEHWYGTVPNCVARLMPNCVAELAAPETSTTEQSMSACGAAILQQNCAEFLTAPPAPCLMPGNLANGSGCEFPTQCASTYCTSSGASLCGTCQPRVGKGGACSPVGDPRYVACQSGLICTYSGSSSACATPIALGGACSASVSNQCAPPLTCLQGQCAPKLSLDGGECNIDTDCAGDTFCSPAFHNTVCRAFDDQPLGAGCNLNAGMGCGAGVNCMGDAQAGTGTCIAAVPTGGSCSTYTDCVAPCDCIDGLCESAVPASSCP